jgi:hypothetical protein
MAEEEEVKINGKFRCAECGGDIVFTYDRISPTFGINDEGNITCISQTIEEDGLIFHCEDDREHVITPSTLTKFYKLYVKWREAVEEKFYKEKEHWTHL